MKLTIVNFIFPCKIFCIEYQSGIGNPQQNEGIALLKDLRLKHWTLTAENNSGSNEFYCNEKETEEEK